MLIGPNGHAIAKLTSLDAPRRPSVASASSRASWSSRRISMARSPMTCSPTSRAAGEAVVGHARVAMGRGRHPQIRLALCALVQPRGSRGRCAGRPEGHVDCRCSELEVNMSLVAITATRVSSNTAPEINKRIKEASDARVKRLASAGQPAIDARLRELDREWDIERCLETGASSLTLLGTVLGVTVNRKWLWLPGGVAAFLLQHAVQGWCPPLPVFRRLGVRTVDEINDERTALQALSGSAPVITREP